MFVQSIKKLPSKKDPKKITESIREWVSNGKDLVKYNEETYYKSRWIIRTSKYLEKLIVRFSEKDRIITRLLDVFPSSSIRNCLSNTLNTVICIV